MEGIRLFSPKDIEELKEKFKSSTHEIEPFQKQGSNPVQSIHSAEDSRACAIHLRLELEGLIRELFAPNIQIRWIEAYFPFTSPRYFMVT
jgi:phenylalanyl-tRNA synthetase alpha chain